jgi:DnaJ family protein C protein 13
MQVGQGGGAWPSWNHAEFAVEYLSLNRHVSVGGVYVRLLLDGSDPAAVDKLPAPRELFAALHHALLSAASAETAIERTAAGMRMLVG